MLESYRKKDKTQREWLFFYLLQITTLRGVILGNHAVSWQRSEMPWRRPRFYLSTDFLMLNWEEPETLLKQHTQALVE